MRKRNTSVRKIKYEENRRVMPCRKYHSITDLYKICKNFGINVSDIDLKTTSKNALMQKIYPNLRFIQVYQWSGVKIEIQKLCNVILRLAV